MKNIFFKYLNRLIVKDFWMVKIWTYFHKSIWIVIFFCFSNFLSQIHVFESFKWGIIFMDFVGFPFRTSKLKNDINYIKHKFSHKFGKVCRWLNIYYLKIRITIFKKIKIMSIWIILKNFVWTCNDAFLSSQVHKISLGLEPRPLDLFELFLSWAFLPLVPFSLMAATSCEGTYCPSWTRIFHPFPHLKSFPFSWWLRIMRRANFPQVYTWPKLETPSQISTCDPTHACVGSQAWLRNKPSHIVASCHLWHSQGCGVCTLRCNRSPLERIRTQRFP